MSSNSGSLNSCWAELIIEELLRTGVRLFVMSPGSRSTPLVVAVARNKRTRSIMHFDERGSAFFALGYARATDEPVALICTSGSAVANYFPAVIEAEIDRLPLILITADRPPELRESGANQTIDQVGIFGRHVRFAVDLPCPTKEISPRFVLTTVDQVVYRAAVSPAGPVHLNCMFREPLEPSSERFDSYLEPIKAWRQNETAFTEYSSGRKTIDAPSRDRLSGKINASENGIIICGRLRSLTDSIEVAKLGETLGWPIFPDPASGLRTGYDSSCLVPYFDLLLSSSDQSGENQAALTVIEFGDPFVSKSLRQFLERAKIKNYILVTDHPRRYDPIHRLTDRVESNAADFCKTISETAEPKVSLFAEAYLNNNAKVATLLESEIDSSDSLSEPAVARLISQTIKQQTCLFLAGSRPIRDYGCYADPKGEAVLIGCNRGASGIDGTVASAIGFGRGADQPVTLLIGDLALLHDLNSLALWGKSDHSDILVVINNDGGGIFSFLSIHKDASIFEKFFGTPHGYRFEDAASMFGFKYCAPTTSRQFRSDYQKAQEASGPTLIEVAGNREQNLQFHRSLQRSISAALSRD